MVKKILLSVRVIARTRKTTMEASSFPTFSTSSCPKSQLGVQYSCSSLSSRKSRVLNFIPNSWPKTRVSISCPRSSLRTAFLAAEEALENPVDSFSSEATNGNELLPKIDKSGRFCSPRAARELALSIVYASCLEGSDPINLFDKRLNGRREPGYEFDKEMLLKYNPMSFGGPPVIAKTIEEEAELLRDIEKESTIEAGVLSAPPKLVYNKLILRFTRKLLAAVVDSWDHHVGVIDRVAPENWKKEPAGRILEVSILHLAMSEIRIVGTSHQIVINEAVDLAKRFCDGAAPRIINGCLGTFAKDLKGTTSVKASERKRKVSVRPDRALV